MSMNELFKGLIGAELTLLGVPNQAMPKSVVSEPTRALPRIDARAEALATAVQHRDHATDEKGVVQFTASDYRTAAG